MGWSCTSAANKTMERLSAACSEMSGHSRNEFRDDDHRFFWEIDRVEHEDGRITGEVMRVEELSSCRSHARFTIAPGGSLSGGHKWMHAALKA